MNAKSDLGYATLSRVTSLAHTEIIGNKTKREMNESLLVLQIFLGLLKSFDSTRKTNNSRDLHLAAIGKPGHQDGQ